MSKYKDDLDEFLIDSLEYLGMSLTKMRVIAEMYDKHFDNFSPTREYYTGLGRDQLCRQVIYKVFSSSGGPFFERCVDIVEQSSPLNVLDHGCGSGAIGYKLAELGHKVTFVDFDEASGFEFLKWRLEKNNVVGLCVDVDTYKETSTISPYDVIISADCLEHIVEWEEILKKLAVDLQDGGLFISNIFRIADNENKEHVSMDRMEMFEAFANCGLYPLNTEVWIKNPKAPLLGAVRCSARGAERMIREAYTDSQS